MILEDLLSLAGAGGSYHHGDGEPPKGLDGRRGVLPDASFLTFGWGSQNNTDENSPSTWLMSLNTTTVSCDGTPLAGNWKITKKDATTTSRQEAPFFICTHASLTLGSQCKGDNGGALPEKECCLL